MSHENARFCLRCELRQKPCNGPCACNVDGRDIIEHEISHYCPHPDGSRFGTSQQPAGWPKPNDKINLAEIVRKDTFHRFWRELHARPFSVFDLSLELGWLESFAMRLPCGECREHWQRLVMDHPPDLSSREAYHRWTIDRHNDVNRRLGKPEWTQRS